MKRPGLITRLFAIVVVLGATIVLARLTIVWAQSNANLDLRPHVVAGGGGSTGSGNKQIDGTVGEPSAGPTVSGGPLTVTGGFWNALAPQPTPLAGPGVFTLSSSSYTVNEDLSEAIITVNRTNGSAGAATVDFRTTNGTGFTPCNQFNTVAAQNCDYALTTGTLGFGAGETSKTFGVLISKDAYLEGNETINLAIGDPTSGATLGAQSAATLTIVDNTSVPASSQPIDDTPTFVGQHYHDFLARSPDPGGEAFWESQITQCGNDQNCIRAKRIDVSNAFFFELEYQQTGAYVFRLYRAAFGNNQPFPNPDGSNQTEAKKLPSYAAFAPDRARVVGGADLPSGQQSFANAFVQRNEFLAKYPAALDGPGFVDAILATVRNDLGVDLGSQRTALINLFNSGGRGAVMYRLADDNLQTNPINNRPLIDVEYNRAFVATQYFGYLRRDADINGFLFWLGQVNSAALRDVPKQHQMICSFITSGEYQNRFSAVVTHSNGECP
jgi:Calx-beta domain